jgi:peroxiredoxin Q/BCP
MRTMLTAVVTIVAMAFAVAVTADDEEAGMLAAGDQMVDFELEAHDGTVVRSSDLEGTPYLMYFYPRADTPGCTKEACELRDAWSELSDLGLEVFGVSYDSPKDNAKFADKYALPFRLLSDSDRELAKRVGAARALLPVPKRISYLVGADGTVLKAYPSVDPKTHDDEVLADFRALTTAG